MLTYADGSCTARSSDELLPPVLWSANTARTTAREVCELEAVADAAAVRAMVVARGVTELLSDADTQVCVCVCVCVCLCVCVSVSVCLLLTRRCRLPVCC